MLVVAPLRVMYSVWPGEIEKWAEFNHLTWTILHGKDKTANLDLDADIFIINPEGMLWLLDDPKRVSKLNIDILCVDESTKFKSHSTRRFKELRKYLPMFPRRWILTGTLVPNGILDLFGQMYILDLGRALGRYITHYRNKYFHQNPWDEYNWWPNDNAYEEISERIAPLLLRLKAEDYLEMPELVSHNVEITLPPRAREIYNEMEAEFIALLESGAVVASNAGAAGTKLRQIANGAVYTQNPEWAKIHDEKMGALDDLLEEILPSPTLVLYEYEHDLQRLKVKYPDAVCVTGLSMNKFKTVESEFNAGRIPLLFGHPASMGHGLNLQGSCHHIVWFGIPWNYEHYDQAIRRVYRQGQDADRVFLYHIVARNTKDEDVLEVLARKDRTQGDMYGAFVKKRQEIYG